MKKKFIIEIEYYGAENEPNPTVVDVLEPFMNLGTTIRKLTYSKEQ